MEWRKAKLGDILKKVVDNRGKTPPLADEGIELIETTSLTGANKFPDYSLVRKHVSKATYDTWFRSGHPQQGDILVATVGANIGSGAIMKEARGCVAQNLVGLRTDKEKADPDFLYYYLTWNPTQEELKRLDIGAAQPSLKVPHLLSVEIPQPPLPEQRRIAGILSAYDDLIENNQRRIRILEEMARALYREWFVHFRFPGHEKLPRVASPLGDIPQGWQVKFVGDTFEILGGGTPSRREPEYWEGGTIQWFVPSDLTGTGTMFMDGSRERITARGLAQCSARLFPERSVMLTSRATIGAITVNTHEACSNQGFITCLPNEHATLHFLFHWLKENVPTFQRLASGATFKEISRGVFKTIEFLQPPSELVRGFEKAVGPAAEQILTLQRQIHNLRRTRDLLLPRFLSGRLIVRNLTESES